MNYDRMRELAGVPPVAPKAVVIETVEEVAVEEVVADEVVADEVVADEVVADEVAAEEVVVEAEADEAKVKDKAPELDTKAEANASKTKVPADVTAAINSRIAELKQSIKQYNDKGYDDGGVKPNAIEALEKIASNLKLEDGLTVANIYYGTLKSPITDLFPPKVVKFLHTAPPAKKVSEAVQHPNDVSELADGFIRQYKAKIEKIVADIDANATDSEEAFTGTWDSEDDIDGMRDWIHELMGQIIRFFELFNIEPENTNDGYRASAFKTLILKVYKIADQGNANAEGLMQVCKLMNDLLESPDVLRQIDYEQFPNTWHQKEVERKEAGHGSTTPY